MLFYKVILIFVSIYVGVICSAKTDSSKGTRIKSVVKVIKSFLEDVHYCVDYNLKIPYALRKFKKIRYRFWKITHGERKKFGRSIRNEKEHFDDFSKEYEKLVEYTKDVVKVYLEEIDFFLNNFCKIGTTTGRQEFCNAYTTKYFDEELALKGFGKDDKLIKKLEQNLKDEAKKLVEKIGNLQDFPEMKKCNENGEEEQDTSSSSAGIMISPGAFA